MEQLQRAFEPYRNLDPVGWVGVFHFLPVWAGLLCLVFGVLMGLFGGRQLFRLVAGPLGAVIATIWAATLANRLGFGRNMQQIATVATVGLFGLGLLYPPVVVFFAFGVPAGLIGGQIAGANDWMLGFGPGFFFGGALGVVLHRPVGAVLSAAVGAWLAVLGLMAALKPFVPAVSWLASNPLAVISVAGCLAIAGAVYQLFVRPNEEQARAARQEKALKKQRAKEQKAAEARWQKYAGKE